MKIGDLVMIRQDIHEYTAERGDSTGIIVSEIKHPSCDSDWGGEKLFDIMWSDSEIETLYSDEIEVVKNESR